MAAAKLPRCQQAIPKATPGPRSRRQPPFDDAPSRAQATLAPSWRALHPGEDPRAEALLFARLRDAFAVEKFAAMRRRTVAARNIALAGLRRRYLGASEAELTRRLADLVLGDELAARAYGPYASAHA